MDTPAQLTPVLPSDNPATGPKTDDGKRIVSRNATTHGLGTREVVLTHLGEDPNDYAALRAELTAQYLPESQLEQHYVEKIAAAIWRLRRLQRWQAQLFHDQGLTLEEGIKHLDSIMRHETALHRQIDQSVRMLIQNPSHRLDNKKQTEQLEGISTREIASAETHFCQNKPPHTETEALPLVSRPPLPPFPAIRLPGWEAKECNFGGNRSQRRRMKKSAERLSS